MLRKFDLHVDSLNG